MLKIINVLNLHFNLNQRLYNLCTDSLCTVYFFLWVNEQQLVVVMAVEEGGITLAVPLCQLTLHGVPQQLLTSGSGPQGWDTPLWLNMEQGYNTFP